MGDEIRPAPLPPTLRDSIIERLNKLDDTKAVVVSLEATKKPGSSTVKGAVYGNFGKGWSFVTFLNHEIEAHDTAVGFEIRKKFK